MKTKDNFIIFDKIRGNYFWQSKKSLVFGQIFSEKTKIHREKINAANLTY